MRYSAVTSASVSEIVRRARDTFGQNGAGLRLTSADLLRVTYSHVTGFVDVSIEPGHGDNTVVIETREFDEDVVRFIRGLPRRSALTQFVRRFRRSKT